MNGGSEANKSGGAWESWVQVVAERGGFSLLPYSERKRCGVPETERRVIWTRAPYETIFGQAKLQALHKTATEFVVEAHGELARIECKWQNTSGSVDEKIPFMYLNAVLTMREPTIVFALGGSYYESGRGLQVKEWLEGVCKKPPHWLSAEAVDMWKKKKIWVQTPNSFERWFRERFPRKNTR